MKDCYLKFGDDEPQPFQVEVEGHGHVPAGTECRAKGVGVFARKGWYRVRIGAKVDHIGTATNRGGAVYAAELLSKPADPAKQQRLW